jgi:hypothetical protein
MLRTLQITLLLGLSIAAAPMAFAQTYAEHIAPLLQKHCVECHRPGVGAPFDLLTYTDASKRARTIMKVVDSGRMPPWKPERGHTPLVGERGMTDDEKATLRAWVDAGTPEGDPALTPPNPVFPASGWRLGTPDLVVQMDSGYDVPAEGPDEYRNFVIPLPDVPPGTWIRGVEYRASAPSVVHHCLIDLDYDGRGRMLDERDEEIGFEALDQIFEDTRIAAYAVGSLPYMLPDGIAYELKPGADLILETHFHPSGKAEREQTTVAFYFTNQPPTKDVVSLQMPPTFGMTTGLVIPAGDPHYELHHQYVLSHDVRPQVIFPHAHMVCREMKSVAKFPDGEEQVLIWIKDWDFAWQELYRFADPPLLPAGTLIDMTWVFDNSEGNPANPNSPPKEVIWGHQTTDEMASLSLTVVPVNNDEAEPLREAHHQYQKKQFRDVSIDTLRPVVMAELMRRFDVNENGKISLFELADILTYWEEMSRKSRGTGHGTWKKSPRTAL